jgi:hypothetical protein
MVARRELARAARDASERLDDDNAVCGLHVASARSALRNSTRVRVGEDLTGCTGCRRG